MNYSQIINDKIFTKKNDIYNLLQVWRFQGQKIVFTNGVFDIIHCGHIEYLLKASSLGTKLIVGVNTDASTRRIKGENRPINNEDARTLVLAALHVVDMVVLFDENTPSDLIQFIQPHILVKGGDYHTKEIVGYDIVNAYAGEVLTLPLTKGFSSSDIIQKIQQLDEKK